tara:strand:- start:262 stop:981 length:720 start_codon:yes stop_codon:yes gene_type:complete
MAEHITKTISNNSYWQINKHLHKQLGLRTTLLLQHFIDLQTKVFHGNEFFQSYKQIEKELCLTDYHIKDSIKRLKEAGVLTIEKKGMPAKNHYFVLLGRVEELLSLDMGNSTVKPEIPQTVKNQPTSEVNITLQDSEKSTNKSVDNQPTYKRINNKRNKEKEIIKNNTDSSVTKEANILKRLLDDLIQFDNVEKFKLSYQEIEEYGGIQKVYKKLNFTESQKNNWTRQINNVISINQAV